MVIVVTLLFVINVLAVILHLNAKREY